MLKKLLKSTNGESGIVFPNHQSKVQNADTLLALDKDSKTVQIKPSTTMEELARLLSNDQSFVQRLTIELSEKVLQQLEAKYGFEPTDKYQEELENRKKYINQLDSYLQERKEINQAVEGELKQFLNETSFNLMKALESFSSSIYQRIRDAEAIYGIDSVRKTFLNDEKK